jgi:hypothetical protein
MNNVYLLLYVRMLLKTWEFSRFKTLFLSELDYVTYFGKL